MWAGQGRGTEHAHSVWCGWGRGGALIPIPPPLALVQEHLRTIHDRNDEGEHEKGHGPGDVAVEVQDKDLQLIHLLQHSRGRRGAGSPLWSP